MSEITTLHKGKFVLVDLVDETIELTVENNVYSRSEALELLDELQKGCSVIEFDNNLANLIKEIEDRARLRNDKDIKND